jgi:uncharacterized membrane protein (DUF485 family)
MSRHAGPEVVSYAGGIVSIASSLTLTDVGVIIGIATALLTFVLNAVYMRRKDKREQLESEAALEKLRGAAPEANDV